MTLKEDSEDAILSLPGESEFPWCSPLTGKGGKDQLLYSRQQRPL